MGKCCLFLFMIGWIKSRQQVVIDYHKKKLCYSSDKQVHFYDKWKLGRFQTVSESQHTIN